MRRCEKMSDVRRCEKISHVRRSFICRSIYTSFFLKNPSLRRSREKYKTIVIYIYIHYIYIIDKPRNKNPSSRSLLRFASSYGRFLLPIWFREVRRFLFTLSVHSLVSGSWIVIGHTISGDLLGNPFDDQLDLISDVFPKQLTPQLN